MIEESQIILNELQTLKLQSVSKRNFGEERDDVECHKGVLSRPPESAHCVCVTTSEFITRCMEPSRSAIYSYLARLYFESPTVLMMNMDRNHFSVYLLEPK